jgi:predicted RNA-binding Zn-ribbon protein involved in translation (DUF1610 family)
VRETEFVADDDELDEPLDDADDDDPLERDEPVKEDEIHYDKEQRKDEKPEGDEEFVVDPSSITSHQCPHCGAFHTFPGFDSIFAYVCEQCGERVKVEHPVQ